MMHKMHGKTMGSKKMKSGSKGKKSAKKGRKS